MPQGLRHFWKCHQVCPNLFFFQQRRRWEWKPRSTISHQLCPNKWARPPPLWAHSALCLLEKREKKRSTSTFQLNSPKPLFQWLDCALLEREGLLHREVHYSFPTWWSVICGFTFMREREMVFEWKLRGEKQPGLKTFSLFTSLNILLHLFVFVLTYLLPSLFTLTLLRLLFSCNMVEISVLNQGYPGCTGVEKLLICSMSLLNPLPPPFLLSCCHFFSSYLVCYHCKACYYLFSLALSRFCVRDLLSLGSEEFPFSVTGHLC